MRAVIKRGAGPDGVGVLEASRPIPAQGQALVRVAASGLCGTDLLLCDDRYRGRNRPVQGFACGESPDRGEAAPVS